MWRQANLTVMNDAAIVPLVSAQITQYASTRVHSATAGTANFNTIVRDGLHEHLAEPEPPVTGQPAGRQGPRIMASA